MAIKFEDDEGGEKTAKKEVGGRTYVAEEPAPSRAEPQTALPFGKPPKPEKKGGKGKR